MYTMTELTLYEGEGAGRNSVLITIRRIYSYYTRIRSAMKFRRSHDQLIELSEIDGNKFPLEVGTRIRVYISHNAE